MKVIIVSEVFPPEPLVTAFHSADIARQLCEEGHHVTVIAPFPNRPAGRLYPGYKRSLFSRELSPLGYPIYHCFSILSSSSTLISRWLENISFGITSGLAALFLARPDVLYSDTWPIFATGMIRFICWLRRIPHVIHVKDLFPEALVSQGRTRASGAIYRLLMAIDGWITRSCQAVIVLSEQFAAAYRERRKVPDERITVVLDWVASDSVIPGAKEDYRRQRNIPLDAFVLVYGGNINLTAGVEGIIQALSLVRSERPVYLVIAGSGSQLKACQALAANLPDTHIVFHSPWDEADKSLVLAAADVFVLPTRGQLASVPSKLIAYLLASRPILAVVLPESDVAGIINKVGCGWTVAPDQPGQVADMVAELSNTASEELDEKGKAGRAYALQNHVSEVCLPKVIHLLMKTAKK